MLLKSCLWIVACMCIAGAEPLAPVLLQVPFFPDKTDQCGPATLAEVLSFWGKEVTPAELSKEIYQRKLHGTLPMDMVLAAQSHTGCKPRWCAERSSNASKSELSAGRPVLAMLNTGFVAVPVDHYVVVTGFDERRSGLYLHSANAKNQFISYKKFLKEWNKTDDWAMLAQKS